MDIILPKTTTERMSHLNLFRLYVHSFYNNKLRKINKHID